jgi:hypothetical protein
VRDLRDLISAGAGAGASVGAGSGAGADAAPARPYPHSRALPGAQALDALGDALHAASLGAVAVELRVDALEDNVSTSTSSEVCTRILSRDTQ